MRKLFLLCFLVLGLVGTAQAQVYRFKWNPRSGDAWIDTWLGDINRYGSLYGDSFTDELVRYYDAPEKVVSELLSEKWPPGDIYFSCALAKVTDRPCREVLEIWAEDHDLGWGVVAKRLSAKAGLGQFHQIKHGMVLSYDRWSRPLVLDHELEDDFPNRGKKR